MIGHRLWWDLGKRYPDVSVTIRGGLGSVAPCRELLKTGRVIEHIDAARWETVKDLFDAERPELILNCIGITIRKEKDTPVSTEIELNSVLPHRIAEWTSRNSAKAIHFSTDCVFDGKSGNYTEADAPNSEALYGRTKALGEVRSPSALTLRTSMIGPELSAHTELYDWLLSQRGKTIRGFRKAMYSGITTIQAAGIVSRIIDEFPGLHGLWNIASRPISKYDLLTLINRRLSLRINIEPDDKFECYRQLDGSRFREKTGIELPSWESMIDELALDATPYEAWSKQLDGESLA